MYLRENYHFLRSIARRSANSQKTEQGRKLAREWAFEELEEGCRRIEKIKDKKEREWFMVSVSSCIKCAAHQAGKIAESRNKND